MAFNLPPPPNTQDLTGQPWRDWFWRLRDAISTGAASAVTSVFGRTGAVVATLGDYTAGQVSNSPAGSIASTTVQGALNELDAEKQTGIQFKDEGTNLGTAGTVDVVDAVGTGIVASRVGNTLTLTVATTFKELLVDGDMNLLFDDNGDLLYEA